jgi:hypothetical protein
VKKFLDWLAAALALALLVLMVGLLAWSEWPTLRRPRDHDDIHGRPPSGLNTERLKAIALEALDACDAVAVRGLSAIKPATRSPSLRTAKNARAHYCFNAFPRRVAATSDPHSRGLTNLS